MKYRPIYMPKTDRNKFDDEPIFNTEDAAWDYIHDKYCHCKMEIHFYEEDDFCVSCESEWCVEKLVEIEDNLRIKKKLNEILGIYHSAESDKTLEELLVNYLKKI